MNRTKRSILKGVARFKILSPTLQGFIVLGILLLIGILLRWNHIVSEIARGFRFFS